MLTINKTNTYVLSASGIVTLKSYSLDIRQFVLQPDDHRVRVHLRSKRINYTPHTGVPVIFIVHNIQIIRYIHTETQD